MPPRQQEKEALDDLNTELELADEDAPVLYVASQNLWTPFSRRCRYRIGEAYVHLPHARALKRLERDLAVLEKELSKLKDQAEGCEKEMKSLKKYLWEIYQRTTLRRPRLPLATSTRRLLL